VQTQRNRLITDHADAARRIALRMARRCPDWIAREDLVAAGMVGLIEAADRYDGSRAEPFLAFAEHRIRGAVLDELRRGDIMPRRARALARKIGEVVRELEKNGETATDQGVATKLGVSVEAYRNDFAGLAHVQVSPLENDQIPANDEAPDAMAERGAQLAYVKRALAGMEARDVTILGLHYAEDLTYQQIAETLGVTPSRVCQLLWRAVDRLRARLGGGAETVKAAA
jgi:RNA polymerase sigma factor for flagellar operon FliA